MEIGAHWIFRPHHFRFRNHASQSSRTARRRAERTPTNHFSRGVSTTFRHWTASRSPSTRDEDVRLSGGNVMKRISAVLALLVWTAGSARAQEQQMLHDGWMIQSSAKVGVDGA